jgi:hypothetical protein
MVMQAGKVVCIGLITPDVPPVFGPDTCSKKKCRKKKFHEKNSSYPTVRRFLLTVEGYLKCVPYEANLLRRYILTIRRFLLGVRRMS